MPRLLVLCCVLLLAPARQAAAEWHITPMLGFTMVGSTSIVDVELATDKRHWNLGGAVTLLGGGILGAEVITIWTPGFFDREDVADEFDLVSSSRSLSLMGNVVLTTPRNWTEYGLRPFVSGGFGLLQAASDNEVLPVNSNLTGFNVGGGAIGFLSNRTGLRFDIRYHSTLKVSDEGPLGFGEVHLRYVTATVGIVFRR
jgi:hypothetical protein